jgi:hypothetical protein
VGTNYAQWVAKLRADADEMVGTRILRLQRSLALLTLGAAVEISPGNIRKILGVVLRTPVDTGRARASWNLSVGTPDGSYPAAGGTYEPLSYEAAAIALRDLQPFDVVWIASGLPYIKTLEYGLYPSPPRVGTWVKGRGFEIRSAGGYSKQAPQGMVRVTVDEVRAILGGVR